MSTEVIQELQHNLNIAGETPIDVAKKSGNEVLMNFIKH